MNASVALAKLFPKELFASYAVHGTLTATAAGRSILTVYLSSLQHAGYCIVWVFHILGNTVHHDDDAVCCDVLDSIELASTHFLKPLNAKTPAHVVFPDIVPPPTHLQFQ